MKKSVPSIRFAESQPDEASHVCVFFNSDDEEYRVPPPFIMDGFVCGNRTTHVVLPCGARRKNDCVASLKECAKLPSCSPAGSTAYRPVGALALVFKSSVCQ